jgi:hypothetical protein
MNPAVGAGIQYRASRSPLSVGVQAIFDFQQPISFTA